MFDADFHSKLVTFCIPINCTVQEKQNNLESNVFLGKALARNWPNSAH